MSLKEPDYDAAVAICDYCGLPITEDDQQCMALDDGRCSP